MSKTLDELYQLWDQLRDIPISEGTEEIEAGGIEVPFLHFQVGTDREEIWHWFEAQNVDFVVGDVMQGIRRGSLLSQPLEATAPEVDGLLDDGNEAKAATCIQKASAMSTDELDDWYEEHVGYRLSEEDPSLVGSPEHAYQVAEMMCLHAYGAEGPYDNLCAQLEQLRSGVVG